MITAIRSGLFLIGQITTLIPFSILSILVVPLPAPTRSRIISGWAHIVTWWLKITCNLKHEVSGLENIGDKPCVFICNHQSAWETIVLQTHLPPMAWVLKRELFRIPLFGWGLWASRPIAINRSQIRNALDQVVEQGKQKLAEGRWVLIFPEGTRMPYGKPGNYKAGGTKLAIEADVDIIPIAHNAGKYWKKNSFLRLPGTIQCRIGKPISSKGKTPKELVIEAKKWIEGQSL